jgi:hypothetical protein
MSALSSLAAARLRPTPAAAPIVAATDPAKNIRRLIRAMICSAADL